MPYSWEEHDWEPDSLQRNKRNIVQAEETDHEGHPRLPGLGGEAKRSVQAKMRLITDLYTNMLALLCVPIEASCQTKQWLENEGLSLYDSTKDEYKAACSKFRRMSTHLNFAEIVEMHTNASNPVYYSRFTNHYLSIDESVLAIEKLLTYQWGEQYSEKLKALVDICERRLGKTNSMFILGPPNSGKTWFVDCLAAFYLNVGHVKNFVRGNNFPLNDCPNRRILIWNEPSIMPSSFDTVKMIAGGDSCPAAIKYEGDGVISKTPLIFTSNNSVFNQTKVWTSRILFTNWKSAPFLKDITCKPHPMSIEILFKKYI